MWRWIGLPRSWTFGPSKASPHIQIIPGLDVYRAAQSLIERSDDAHFHAAMWADEMMEAGDMDGVAVWLQILNAVDELLARVSTPE